MRDGFQFTSMLPHPRIDGGIGFDSTVEPQQFRSHPQPIFVFGSVLRGTPTPGTEGTGPLKSLLVPKLPGGRKLAVRGVDQSRNLAKSATVQAHASFTFTPRLCESAISVLSSKLQHTSFRGANDSSQRTIHA